VALALKRQGLIIKRLPRNLEDTLAFLIWGLAIAFFVTFGAYIFYTSREAIRDNGFETGQAIMRFGKAFPMEAIREVIVAKNGDSYFLRLHGGRTGCIIAYQKHAVCRILEPGSVHIHAGPKDDSISIEFVDSSLKDATFIFRSPKDAAEVSLWLLGSFVAANQSPDALDQDPTLLPPGNGQ